MKLTLCDDETGIATLHSGHVSVSFFLVCSIADVEQLNAYKNYMHFDLVVSGKNLKGVIQPYAFSQLKSHLSYLFFRIFLYFSGDKDQYVNLTKIQMVHVDDVARAHIFLLEYPEAKGRYICTSVDMTMDKMSEFLLARYPEYPIPTPE